MKLIDEEFLIREYKIVKENAIQGSLLYSKEEDSKQRTPYYHVSDPQKNIYSCNIGTSSYQSMKIGNRKQALDASKISLAKCLLLAFEKCLNLHHLDYLKKLTIS